MTHPQVCRSTLPCHCPDRHTPTCSLLFHGVSARCHLSYMKPRPHDSGLDTGEKDDFRDINMHPCFSTEGKHRKRHRNKHSRHFSHYLTTQLTANSCTAPLANKLWRIWRLTSLLASVWETRVCTEIRAWMCGLGLEWWLAAGQLLVELIETHAKTQTYWQWCSWSCPSQSQYRYSPRSCRPWVSHRFLPQSRTARWSYRSTFPLIQGENNGNGNDANDVHGGHRLKKKTRSIHTN